MKALTIVGRGPSWKECQFNTEELWGTATCLVTEGLKNKNFTKVFAFDGIEVPAIQTALAIAKERGIPMVSNREYATETYPLREIAREFWSSYFMPTISYMIAYALYLKYDRIYIYGIDQGPRWDHLQGKHHVVFWLGVAVGRKVDLRIGRNSMRWAYRMGLSEFPEAFLVGVEGCIAQHIKAVRDDEIQDERTNP